MVCNKGGAPSATMVKPLIPLTTKDGLAHNNISKIYESSDKDIWFATEGGVTQYTPTRGGLPFYRLTALKADKTYTTLSSSIDLPAYGNKHIILYVRGISHSENGSPMNLKSSGWIVLDGHNFQRRSSHDYPPSPVLHLTNGFPHRNWRRDKRPTRMAFNRNFKTKMAFYAYDIRVSKQALIASSSRRSAKTGPTHIHRRSRF